MTIWKIDYSVYETSFRRWLVSKTVLCGLFGYTRQAWYDNNKRQTGRQMEEVFILVEALKLRKELKRMGTEKMLLLMQPTLKEHTIKIWKR